ncbi:MAG: Fur family transcriptional regulator [Microbacterium gubbeenense]|uniref:Fur family transcriptional regulator n=1 Tax=Microbacterium gubbeenense TaxID=159896 RepID=UPI000402D839|nr:Fur family transcriptional regulator [Microbacterium gubbeenense]
MLTAIDAPARLRGAGLRVTTQRTAVLEALAETAHAAVDELHERVQTRIPGVALQTVHGIVNDLTSAGIAQRVSLPGATSALYEMARGDNHHHVQCVVCGRVEDVDCVVGAAPCLTPSHTHGMRVLEAAITFRGVCADCEQR